jgi:hypothetical protein
VPPEAIEIVAFVPAVKLFVTDKLPVPLTVKPELLFTLTVPMDTVPFEVRVKLLFISRVPVIIKVPPAFTVIPSPFCPDQFPQIVNVTPDGTVTIILLSIVTAV